MGSGASGMQGGGAVMTAMDLDKQMNLWERRVKGLRRMLLGWDQTKPPEAPVSVFVDVIDATSVSVKVHETTEGPLGTKFKGTQECNVILFNRSCLCCFICFFTSITTVIRFLILFL